MSFSITSLGHQSHSGVVSSLGLKHLYLALLRSITKYPKINGLKKQTFALYSLEARTPRSGYQYVQILGEASLPNVEMTVLVLYPHVDRRKISGFFI